ncbi:MAG: nucleoside deaminase [Xanthomonadales bacterium]|jgi:tRNA(Arg) A34 adenosine deaminase TadA|nr:nucleoside deaminase [Xanthomonadales bacterium]
MKLATRCELELPSWVQPFLAQWDQPLETLQQRMALAVALSGENIDRKTGGPFGAIVVEEQGGRLLGAGVNLVTQAGISLAHAEMVALSLAQAAASTWNLGTLGGVQLVTSCEPCAMCFGAVPWSGVRSLVWGAQREDAEACGFDEGSKPVDWRNKLENRGITTQGEILRREAVDVLARYVHSDGTIYNPERP